MRTGRAAGGAHESQRVAASDCLADGHRNALVVPVAGDQAIAMADFDERSIAGLLTRKGDHAGGHGDDVRATGAGEVDALVEGLVAREVVLALAEIGGNVALAHRTAVRADLLV